MMVKRISIIIPKNDPIKDKHINMSNTLLTIKYILKVRNDLI